MNTNIKDDTKQEHEANFFARCLLLPQAVLEAHIERNEPSILASAFDVPLDVSEERQKEIA